MVEIKSENKKKLKINQLNQIKNKRKWSETRDRQIKLTPDKRQVFNRKIDHFIFLELVNYFAKNSNVNFAQNQKTIELNKFVS